MVEKRKPIPVEEAVQKVMEHTVVHPQTEMVSIDESYGRFLAEDLLASHDVPAFDRSPYDGFAIRAEDTNEANSEHPISFEVVGEIGAGYVFEGEVKPFQAVRIMTGAPIPTDCNAVVMLELTKEISDKKIEIKRAFKDGDNISYQGEDTKKGTVLVEKGTQINPGVVALLATFGYHQVTVAKKPVIGVIATGSELLDVDEPLAPGKIRNSNAYMIIAQIERAGGEALYVGKLDDDLEACLNATKEALSKVDMLITTGGVSVGDYDYVPAILNDLGADVLFNKVAMRPGSVTTVATVGEKAFYGLSGNPSACYVGFELFVRPIIRRSLFCTHPHLQKVTATLGVDFPKVNPFMRLVRARVSYVDGALIVSPSGVDKSGIVSSLGGADCLLLLPGGTRGYQKGMSVDVLLLESTQGSEWPWNNIVPSYR
ncbi:molybdopterin molybdotransferase MoeA [Alkalihalophilus lindianensis]|uniref:Molybdopterin molybdenumtransferase n=1 Tax=Alkalihalophilus lindianensis TaxID=1630542 RepID=A0ABU3XDQ8_9BACI|nr:gephyrin-like molybdotransferase Glp [Alkalihalophilus lindianensis]MDV2686015.1 molybdopterin molybdotransferase MoeA [Alkalihalophilus lindianensis]